MTDTPWAPPAPPKKRRRWPWIAAVAAVGIGIGAAAGSNTSTRETATTDRPNATTTDRPDTTTVRTDAQVTFPPPDPFDQWLLLYGEEVAGFADRIVTISDDIVAAADTGSEALLTSECFQALMYISDIEDKEFVTEGPDIFIEAIDAYNQSYTACAAGDYETATFWQDEGTRLIVELTDMIDR